MIGGLTLWIFDYAIRIYSTAKILVSNISANLALEPEDNYTKNGIIELSYKMHYNKNNNKNNNGIKNNNYEKVIVDYLMGQYMYINIPEIDSFAW